MGYSEFVFVDFENVQSFDLGSLDDNTKIYIFVGRQQKKIPFELVTSAQRRGGAIEWIQISGQGRNALDFHIAYYLGELNQTTSKDVRFTVLSKDTGYDPLIQFVHEEDCLHAYERATREPHPGVFNIVGRGVAPLSTLLRLAGKRILPLPAPILFRMTYYPSQAQTGDPPAAFYDYLRWLWVADGARGFDAFGEPVYTTKEAWISFVSERRMRRYR